MSKHILTKREIAEALIASPAWDGCKDPAWLCKRYSWEELHDAYEFLEQAEDEYYL